jgi:hypothetical protein
VSGWPGYARRTYSLELWAELSIADNPLHADRQATGYLRQHPRHGAASRAAGALLRGGAVLVDGTGFHQTAATRMLDEEKFPTGALATLVVRGEGWTALGPGAAELVDYVVPEQLR